MINRNELNGQHAPSREEARRRGTFVFSLDTELAWGQVHRGSYAGHERDFEQTRYVIDRLLELFEKYEIRGTWAVVGHLFLDACGEVDGVRHPEITRPAYSWFPQDWFHRDPCSNSAAAPWWYGPDIVRKIQTCKIQQEIGCHNFSHVIVGDPGCSELAFDSELKASVAASSKSGVRPTSFVYPRNAIGHVSTLVRNGFTSYRGMAPAWFESLPSPVVRFARLADSFLPIPAPITRPEFHDGIWDLKASYFYRHRNGWAKLIPVSVQVMKATASLRKAAREGAVFHMWTHPFNVASDPDRLLNGLERIFQEVKNLTDSGLLVSRTMTELAETAARAGKHDGEAPRQRERQVASVG
jgi:peptidoglycan/xylan/chitin deacetylase (PgdA/CDA1 family)